MLKPELIFNIAENITKIKRLEIQIFSSNFLMASHSLFESRNILRFFFGSSVSIYIKQIFWFNLPSLDVKKTARHSTNFIIRFCYSYSRETEIQVWGLDQGHSQRQNQIKIHVPRVLSMPLLHLLTHGVQPEALLIK